MDSSGKIIAVDGRVRLRPWRMDDLDALVRHADDAQVSRGTSDRFPHPYTRADGEAFLSGQVVDFSEPLLAIEIDGEACGSIGARAYAGERRIGAEFGYWLARKHWGQGLMTRIVAAYLPWAMAELAVTRMQATVLDFNLGSARVLEKNGFVEEGVLRAAVLKRGQVHDLRVFGRVDRTAM